MKLQSRLRQAGFSIIGLILVIAALASVGVLAAQALPTFLEYQSVLKAVNTAKEAGSPAEARQAFDRTAQIDDIKSISGRDLQITQNSGRMVLSFAYSKEIHMFGPAYLLLKYSGQTK